MLQKLRKLICARKGVYLVAKVGHLFDKVFFLLLYGGELFANGGAAALLTFLILVPEGVDKFLQGSFVGSQPQGVFQILPPQGQSAQFFMQGRLTQKFLRIMRTCHSQQ